MEKKRGILHVVICISLVCLIWGGYIVGEKEIRKRNEIDALIKMPIEFDYNLLGRVEEVKEEDGEISISGWALRVNSKNSSIQLVLQPTDNSDECVLTAKTSKDETIGEYYVQDWEFGETCFLASVNKDTLEKDTCYKVLIALGYEQKTEDTTIENKTKIATNQYLYNGKLYQYNPKEFELPSIEDEEIVRVLNEGDLRAYDMEHKFWIYQYDGKLFYIVDMAEKSMKEENIRIPVMPYTSQVELLPEHRKQHGFDHLGAITEETKYCREGILPYQIAVIDLKEDYPITYVNTGLFDVDSQKFIKQFYILLEEYEE